MAKNYYLSGQWNVTCDVCSKKIKSSEAKHRWDGFITCPDCWEQRQPLDFIRARTDKITVPFQRPIPTLEFVPQDFEERLTDLVITDELLQRTVAYIRSYSDSVSFTDTLSSQMDHGRSFSDTVSITDTLVPLLVTLLELTDTVSISEVIGKTISIPRTDTTTINDSVAKAYGLNPTDTKSVTDTMVKTISIAKTDGVSPVDVMAFTQSANDSINATAINTQAI